MLEGILKLEAAIRELLGNTTMTTVIMAESKTIEDYELRAKWLEQLVKLIMFQDKSFMDMLDFVRVPVSPREFLLSPSYLNKAEEVYPEVLKEYEELCSGNYDEAVLTGGIGSAKTTTALYAQAYQLYILSCMVNPQRTYNLDPSTEIKIIFQSLRASTARGVDYERFRAMIDKSPYFQQMFPYDKSSKSILKFPNRIIVAPLSGSETAAIGENIIGGIIDEINFMDKIKNSKQSVDGGTYDQAVELYNSIARRRKSRFMSGGKMAGLLCVVSSKRLPDEFTDRKMKEAKTNKRIFVYDKRVWDIKPDAFKGERFKVFIGSEGRRPRIIEQGETIPDSDKPFIDEIPIVFLQEFRDDITKAIRDIAGHSTLATMPFLPNSELVTACFRSNIHNIIRDGETDFQHIPCVIQTRYVSTNEFPRYAHIDLALTGDSAGVAIGHCPSFSVSPKSGELMPDIVYDLILEVKPPKGGEIEFSQIRKILYKLVELGLPIKWVSLDSFQSRDTIQLLRGAGFAAGLLSMDTSMLPYDVFKQALYDNRVYMPEHPKAKKELLALEINYADKKVDHNAHNSKDVSDALAGVTYGLTTRREVWAMHGVPIVQSLVRKENLREGGKVSENAVSEG